MNIDLAKIAALAKLDLSAQSEAQWGTLRGQLQAMIDLAQQVQSAPIKDLTPLYHPIELSQPLREDIPEPTPFNRLALLTNAPEHDNAAFLVPKVMD